MTKEVVLKEVEKVVEVAVELHGGGGGDGGGAVLSRWRRR